MNCVFVHPSSTHEFGAMRSDCLVQLSILNRFSEPHELCCRHVSSTFEFGAMRSDCLVQFSILNPFSEPHELHFRSCILQPKSLELCFMID